MQKRITLLLLLLLTLCGTARPDKKVVTTPVTATPDTYLQPLPPTALIPTPAVSFTPQKRSNQTRRWNYRMGKTRGIDVSHYQGNINWRTVAADRNVSYVYIKATEGMNLVDNMYYQNLRGAHAAGIPVGTYHFFSPTASVTTQINNLISAMPNLREQDLVPMIDVETIGKASPDNFRSRLRQFLASVEQKYGVKPIIYTGTNFYNKYLRGHFDNYLFMIAKYSEGFPELQGNPKFAIWQYSSTGRVSGIRGYVDQSVFIDDYDLKDIMLKKR